MSEFRRRLMMAEKGGGIDYSKQYLTFEALESGTFTIKIGSSLNTTDFEKIAYSIDEGVTWVETNNVDNQEIVVTTPTILAGEKVIWRGLGQRTANGGGAQYSCIFSSSGNFDVSGNVMSLIYWNNFDNVFTLSQIYSFSYLFYICGKVKNAGNMILPATTLAERCYFYMFYGSGVTEAPTLPAQILVQYCYYYMFNRCGSISYCKMLATDISALRAVDSWLWGTPNTSSCIFVKHIDATWTTTGGSVVPTNWTIIYYDPAVDKYYTDQTRSQECDDHGNPL